MRTSIARFLLALVLTLLSGARDWPTSFEPAAGTGRTTRVADSAHRWRSRSFDVISFRAHSPEILAALVTSAESVPDVLKVLPLPLLAPPEDGPAVIRIHPDEKSYLGGGGAPGTAGFYDARNRTVLLQWDFLFDRQPPRGDLPEPRFDMVIHELTHLSMHRLIPRVEVWISEGIAEYLAAAHVGKGHYRFDHIEKSIASRIRSRHPQSRTSHHLPPLSVLLEASPQDWLAETAHIPASEVMESYDAALLLVHFCFHGGAKRREELNHHLKVAHQRTPATPLLPTIKAPAIEQSLVSFWQKRGLKLTFRER